MVYLVYRTPHVFPLARKILTFEDENLVDWFRRIWPPKIAWEQPENWEATYQQYFDPTGLGSICGMGGLWEDMIEHGPQPESDEALMAWLDGRSFSEGNIEITEHTFQSYADADELQYTVLIFDSEFAEANSDRVTFLLREDWKLPETISVEESDETMFQWDGELNDLAPTGSGKGETFAALIVVDDCCWLTDLLGPYRFTRTRVPQLASFLREVEDEIIKESQQIERWFAPQKWRPELIHLRTLAIESEVDQFGELLRLFDKADEQAFAENNSPSGIWSYQRLPSIIQVSQHMVQIAFGKTTSSDSFGDQDTTWSWCFFDDVWACSHPDLARSLLGAAKKSEPLFG